MDDDEVLLMMQSEIELERLNRKMDAYDEIFIPHMIEGASTWPEIIGRMSGQERSRLDELRGDATLEEFLI
jgi:hypothetical protein